MGQTLLFFPSLLQPWRRLGNSLMADGGTVLPPTPRLNFADLVDRIVPCRSKCKGLPHPDEILKIRAAIDVQQSSQFDMSGAREAKRGEPVEKIIRRVADEVGDNRRISNGWATNVVRYAEQIHKDHDLRNCDSSSWTKLYGRHFFHHHGPLLEQACFLRLLTDEGDSEFARTVIVLARSCGLTKRILRFPTGVNLTNSSSSESDGASLYGLTAPHATRCITMENVADSQHLSLTDTDMEDGVSVSAHEASHDGGKKPRYCGLSGGYDDTASWASEASSDWINVMPPSPQLKGTTSAGSRSPSATPSTPKTEVSASSAPQAASPSISPPPSHNANALSDASSKSSLGALDTAAAPEQRATIEALANVSPPPPRIVPPSPNEHLKAILAVGVRGRDFKESSLMGTAFVVDAVRGLAATCAHVVWGIYWQSKSDPNRFGDPADIGLAIGASQDGLPATWFCRAELLCYSSPPADYGYSPPPDWAFTQDAIQMPGNLDLAILRLREWDGSELAQPIERPDGAHVRALMLGDDQKCVLNGMSFFVPSYGQVAGSGGALGTLTQPKGNYCGSVTLADSGRWVKTDCYILDGASGSPLLCAFGQVIGWAVKSNQLGFARPVSELLPALRAVYARFYGTSDLDDKKIRRMLEDNLGLIRMGEVALGDAAHVAAAAARRFQVLENHQARAEIRLAAVEAVTERISHSRLPLVSMSSQSDSPQSHRVRLHCELQPLDSSTILQCLRLSAAACDALVDFEELEDLLRLPDPDVQALLHGRELARDRTRLLSWQKETAEAAAQVGRAADLSIMVRLGIERALYTYLRTFLGKHLQEDLKPEDVSVDSVKTRFRIWLQETDKDNAIWHDPDMLEGERARLQTELQELLPNATVRELTRGSIIMHCEDHASPCELQSALTKLGGEFAGRKLLAVDTKGSVASAWIDGLVALVRINLLLDVKSVAPPLLTGAEVSSATVIAASTAHRFLAVYNLRRCVSSAATAIVSLACRQNDAPAEDFKTTCSKAIKQLLDSTKAQCIKYAGYAQLGLGWQRICAPCSAYVHTLSTKAKLLITFYQIAVKVPSIYEVTLPDSSRALLAAFQAIVGFGLDGVSVPLQCMGLHGYVARLAFFTVAPLVLVVAVAGVGVARAGGAVRPGLVAALPTLLKLLFFACAARTPHHQPYAHRAHATLRARTPQGRHTHAHRECPQPR